MPILNQLRLTPRAVCKVNGIRTGPEAGSFFQAKEGGRCQIIESDDGKGIYTLSARAGAGTDYFFPWLQRDWTFARVPKNVPDGTIVLTGGVNGCTLIVSEDGNDYIFHHDGDSKFLPLGSDQIVGNEIVRITPTEYDPGDFTYSAFRGFMDSMVKAKQPISGDISYGNFVLFVKVNGQFEACATSVISIGTPMALPGHYIQSF